MGKKNIKTVSIEDDSYVKVDLPNSNAILILGILSIIGCFMLGIVGLVLGIISRNLSKKPIELYQLAPELYTKFSYKNIKSGQVCATIGISLSSVSLLIILIFLVLRGAFFSIF